MKSWAANPTAACEATSGTSNTCHPLAGLCVVSTAKLPAEKSQLGHLLAVVSHSHYQMSLWLDFFKTKKEEEEDNSTNT